MNRDNLVELFTVINLKGGLAGSIEYGLNPLEHEPNLPSYFIEAWTRADNALTMLERQRQILMNSYKIEEDDVEA